MSKPFSKLKNCLSLDDRITFGSKHGMTLEEVIDSDPAYIRWCLKQDNLLFISEKAELHLNKREKEFKQDRHRDTNYFYAGNLQGDMANFTMEQIEGLHSDDAAGWLEDVPW